MKWTDVDPSKIWVDAIEINNKETKKTELVPLIRYGSEKKSLLIQGPWIKMSQYGIPPGKMLANNIVNQYYTTEDARFSMKFPLDPNACSIIDENTNKSNKDDIKSFIDKLEAIDERIKSSKEITDACKIKDKNIARYKEIYRTAESSSDKPKYNYMKTKFAINYKSKLITTEFWEINKETKENMLLNKAVNSEKVVELKDIEALVSYNCEQQPIFQLVKVWTQATGDWGVTLKLMKSRIRKQVYSEKKIQADFIDDESDNVSDDEPVVATKQEVKSVTTSSKPVTQQLDSDSDGSDDEPVVATKQVETKPKVVETAKKHELDSDSDSDNKPTNDSDSDSDIKPVTNSKKKVIDSDSDSDSPVIVKQASKPRKLIVEDEKPVAKGKAKTTKTKTSNA